MDVTQCQLISRLIYMKYEQMNTITNLFYIHQMDIQLENMFKRVHSGFAKKVQSAKKKSQIIDNE